MVAIAYEGAVGIDRAAHQLAGTGFDCSAVLGAELPQLLTCLGTAPTWAIRSAAVDDLLLKRLAGAPPRSLIAGAALAQVRRGARDPPDR